MKIRGFAVGSAPCCVPAAFTKDCVGAGHSASQACRKTHCRRPSECGGQMLCSIFLENRLVVQTLRPKSQHLGQWYLEVRREKFTSFTASLDFNELEKEFCEATVDLYAASFVMVIAVRAQRLYRQSSEETGSMISSESSDLFSLTRTDVLRKWRKYWQQRQIQDLKPSDDYHEVWMLPIKVNHTIVYPA